MRHPDNPFVSPRPCPKCGRSGTFLPFSSTPHASYYRCQPPCNHVWSYNNRVPDAPPRDVTVDAPDRAVYPLGVLAR